MKGLLPGGAWEALFPRALVLIDEIRKHGGLGDPFWTFGGGTVLMLRYRQAFLEQIGQPHPSLRAGFDAIATLEYTPSFDHCVTVASGFLGGL